MKRAARSRCFEGFGGPAAQFVNPAMHIGIVILIKPGQRFEDGTGLLRGGGIVQINQGMAMHLLVEDWKILAQRFHVEQSGLN
jgi:hypothetical protein